MEFHSGLNLLLEALSYLGRRADGYGTDWMLQRLHSRGVEDMGTIEAQLVPIDRLMKNLDQAVKVDEERLAYLFGNLPGFAHNTFGAHSRGFLLLYPMIAVYRGDLQTALEQRRSCPKEQIAGDLAMMLDLGEEPRLSGEELTARILSLNVPDVSKVAVLELYHRGGELLDEAVALVEQVLTQLEQETDLLGECCAGFLRQIREQGPEALLDQTSALNFSPERTDMIRPFLFGIDALLTVPPYASSSVQVYCGILRSDLQTALATARGAEVEVYEAIRLLADQTRFDILCYLHDRDAYGQELATRFGLSRNTIHHHMSKLLAAHLVKCTVDGNRVYYRVDEMSVSRLLDRQRELLLPGK